MLKKLLNLFTGESSVPEFNKEDISYEEEFLEFTIDEKFLIDEYWDNKHVLKEGWYQSSFFIL